MLMVHDVHVASYEDLARDASSSAYSPLPLHPWTPGLLNPFPSARNLPPCPLSLIFLFICTLPY